MPQIVPDQNIPAYAPEWPSERPTPGDEWAVWNAPRPLVGEQTWNGPFAHGVFYAAHRRGAPYFADVEAANAAADGWPVVLITDAEIRAAVVAALAEYGYTLDSCGPAGIDPADVADGMGLPWNQEV